MHKLSKEKQDAKNVKRKQKIFDKATSSNVMKAHEGIQQSLPVMFNNKATVDQSVARAFYSANILHFTVEFHSTLLTIIILNKH